MQKRLLYLCLIVPFMLLAEGTKEIQPNTTDIYYLLFNRGGSGEGLNVPFGLYTPNTINYPAGTVAQDYRFNIHICRPGERVRLGFQANANNVWYRVKDPNGNIVFGPINIPTTNGSLGYINDYNQAVAGPRSRVGAAGYVDTGFVATMQGDYYIEFNRSHASQYRTNQFLLRLFDISVYGLDNSYKPGRIWSKAWQLADVNNPFAGSFFIYSDDGIVTKFIGNGIEPHYFSVSCNPTGCTNTGNPVEDRKSRNDRWLYPQYKVFLNDPDQECFPTGSFGNVIGTPNITGCGNDVCINVNVDKPGVILVTLDLNGVPGFQQNTRDRQIQITAVQGVNCVQWDGRDGLGDAVLNGTPIPLQVDFLNGITHLPLYDVEENRNGILVDLIRPAGPRPRIFWDDSNITAGAALDGLVNLTGCTNATGCHRFRSRGDNACPPCSETINSWWYAKVDTARTSYGHVAVNVNANRLRPGRGDANNETLCGTLTPIQLRGFFTGSQGIVWSSNGTGVFSNVNDVDATYTPSAQDVANGSVRLTITSVGNGVCPGDNDFLIFTLITPPTANAGPDTAVCANNRPIKLNGSFSNAASASWVGGGGSFTPNRNTLDATYTPSNAEINAGNTLTLTLRTAAGGVCPQAQSQIRIAVRPTPVVNAGSNQTICTSNPQVQLNGTSSTGAGVWSFSGVGTNFANPNALATTYNPTAANLAANNYTLRLTSANNGACLPVTSDITINNNKNGPTINLGADRSVCETTNAVTLSSTETFTNGRNWSGNGGTFNPGGATSTSATPTYTFSSAEKALNRTFVTAVTTQNNNCIPARDTLWINIVRRPEANAGADRSVCVNSNNPLTAVGTVTRATGGTWSSLGGGTFSPNANSLNASYTPTETERNVGFTYLVLTTIGNGLCQAVSDTSFVFFTPSPIINAGSDAQVCNNNRIHDLTDATAISTDNLGYQWTSNGSGIFQPGSTVLNPTYLPSLNDTLIGNITLTLTVRTLNNDCSPVSDSKVLTFLNTPNVSAGVDKIVCKNNSSTIISGSSSTGSGVWSGGTGTFAPNRNALSPTYTPSTAEINNGSPISLTFSNTNTGICAPKSSSMSISLVDIPVINAGSDQTICRNKPQVKLSGTSSTGQARWVGGNGSFIPHRNDLNVTYDPNNTEVNSSAFDLILESMNNGLCNPVRDTIRINITPSPTIQITEPINVCADAPTKQLNATTTVALGIQWTAQGTFTPNAIQLNPVYSPTLTQIQNGQAQIFAVTTVNGICNPVADTATMQIAPVPVVFAGADIQACGNVNTINLSGTVSNAGGLTWRTLGTGTFSNVNALNPVYTPSQADKNNGIVQLIATSTGNGLCQPVSDTVNVLFSTVPISNAGSNFTVCSNDFPLQLNATGSLGSWVGGQGVFLPARNVLNPSYTPTAQELINGSIVLTYTTEPNGACQSVSSSITITLKPSPIANAGPDQSICGNFNGINLNGSVSNANGGRWSVLKGTGSFSPLPTALNAQYQITSADKESGEVVLVLSTTGNQECSAVNDTLRALISPVVGVFAGPDQTFCSNNISLQLNGVVTNSTILLWSGGDGEFLPNRNIENPIYRPTQAEINSGSLSLTLTSNEIGPCPTFSDGVTFTFTPSPTVSAGSDLEICADRDSIRITGNINNIPTGVRWKSNGSGTFSPSFSSINPIYFPSESDKNSGGVFLSIETTGSGTCIEIADTLFLKINPRPTVEVGADIKVCADQPSIPVNAVFQHAGNVSWTTTGSGSFQNPASAQTTYQLSAQDISNGILTLRANTTNNGLCQAVNDQLVVEVTPAPTIEAGNDRTICANTDQIAIQGSFTIATGMVWTSTGTGDFLADSSNSTVYVLSASDKQLNQFKIYASTTGNGLCQAVRDSFLVNVDPVPTIDIGSDRTICADSIGIPLTSQINHATGVVWSSTGTGSFFPNTINRNPNFAISNLDRSNGAVEISAMTTGNGACQPVNQTIALTILKAPTVDAGTDLVVCATKDSILLSGEVQNVSTGRWFTSGSGVFVPNDTTTVAYYLPSATDKAAGNVLFSLQTINNGLCKPVFDQKSVVIRRAPTVNAGPDRTLCSDEFSVNLNGTSNNGNGVGWSSLGSGVFSNISSTATTYSFSDFDYDNEQVSLVLTNLGNDVCDPISDTATITLTPKPSLTVSESFEICRDVNLYNINSTFSVSSGIEWKSNGSGQFSPSRTSPIATYTPSEADKNNGFVVLSIETTGNGICKKLADSLRVTITPSPTIFVSGDATTCVDQKGFYPFANITVATGVKWETSGSGVFSPNDVTQNVYYEFSDLDSLNGSVTLQATTTGVGTCNPRSASMQLTILPKPTVDAGPDITTCTGQDTVQISGRIQNAGGGFWISSGTGSFYPNDFELETFYLPSAQDHSSGSVSLVLVTADNGFCETYTDTLVIRFTSAPEIDAGPDRTICKTDFPITLQAFGPNAVWVGGNGIFTPTRNSLNATYQPSADEIAGNGVKLFVETVRNGSCTPGIDSVTFTFIEGPIINAGVDTTICANSGGIRLYATSNGVSSGVRWSTSSGTGNFQPSNTNLDAVFVPSVFQINNGVANLTITTTGNGFCRPASDNLRITILPKPIIYVGPDVQVCADVEFVEINAQLQNATQILWTSVGNGGFDDQDALSTRYYLSQTDINNGFARLIATTKNVGLCVEESDTLIISIIQRPTINVSNDTTLCQSFENLRVNASRTGALGLIWTSLGNGVFSPSAISSNPNYFPSENDRSLSEIKLVATTTGIGTCRPVHDTLIISLTPVSVVNAGDDREICETLQAISVDGTANTSILWSTLGNGDFADNTSLNTTYLPTTNEILAGGFTYKITSTANNECPDLEDYSTLKFRKLPAVLVNAGFDQELCKDNVGTQLQGFILNAGGGVWSNVSGNGVFGSVNSLETSYQFTSQDTSQDSILVRLTSVDNGVCDEVFDEMVIRFTPIPTINAGVDELVCSDTSGLRLNAQFTVAGGIRWNSNGSGFFTPNEFVNTAVYVPSDQDRTRPNLILTAVTTDNGTCLSYTDQMQINIRQAPRINAGGNREVCKDIVTLVLNGTVNNAIGGVWTSSGDGLFSPNNLTGAYIPSVADKQNDAVLLSVSSTENGVCKPASDRIRVDFTPIPVVHAGIDQIHCGDGTAFVLNGNVQVATGGTWNSMGTGVFLGVNNLNSEYIPSVEDLIKQQVKIVLTSTGNGNCNPVKDTVSLTFQEPPFADAGPALSCAYADGVPLNGTFRNAGGVSWTSTGTGAFSASPALTSIRYFPSSKDFEIRSMTLTMQTTSNGVCPPASSSTSLIIRDLPEAIAGNDRLVCTGSPIDLNGNFSPDYVSYEWRVLETGEQLSGSNISYSNVSQRLSFELMVTNQYGCFDADTVVVDKVDPVAFNMPDHQCLNVGTQLNSNIQPLSGLATFQWYRNGALIQGADLDYFRPLSSGNYALAYSIDLCTYLDSTNVTDLPVLVPSQRLTCVDNPITVSTNLLQGVTYDWSFGTANLNSSSFNAAADTNFIVVRGTDALGCQNTATVRVIGAEKPVLTVSGDSSCAGNSLTFNGTPQNLNRIVAYQPVAFWQNAQLDTLVKTYVFETTESGTYTFNVNIGECATSKDIAARFNALPVLNLRNFVKFCSDSTTSIVLDAGLGSNNPADSLTMKYLWSTGQTTRTIRISDEGVYRVSVTNKSNCEAKDSIKVADRCPPLVFVPDAFTPTLNGANEKAFIKGKHYSNFNITIFNRWGEIVFYSDDKNESWDGKYKGELVPVGVYPYVLNYEGVHDEYRGPYNNRGRIIVIK